MRGWFFILASGCALHAANARLFAVHDGEHCGYAEASGKVVVAAQFRDCGDFSEGLAAVQSGDRWGYIDEEGVAVIAARFLAADRFSENLAFVTLDDQAKAVIDRKGEVVFRADYYEHGRFSEGLAAVRPVARWICPADHFEVRSQCSDGKGLPRDYRWGYIDRSGRIAIPAEFFGASKFHEGLAYADGGFIDHQGNKAIPGPFSAATAFANGAAAVQVDHKAWGYVDKRGGWLTQPTFERAGAIEDGRGLVKVEGEYGYVDASGALAIAPQFDDALGFSEERAAVRKDGKWGYIGPSGGIVIPFQFDAAQSFEDGFATVVMDSRTVVIDRRGTPVQSQPPSLAQTFQRLQGFEVEPGREGPLDEVLPILAIYKQQLRQLATESLREGSDPAAIRVSIDAGLRKAGIRRAGKKEMRPYGLLQDLEVVQAVAQPGLLAVLFHLNLAGAIDTSLSIFRRGASSWTLVYQVDRNDYFKWDGDAYHIAPPQFSASDANGSFFMLLASDSGRSADGSYGLWVDLYRADGNFHLDPLFHTEYGCKRHQIALDADGFRLETLSMEHDASRGGSRVYPYRYEVKGDRVVRVAPIAFDAHDFVEEWGNLPWEEAAGWSDPARIDKLHEYFNKLRTADGYFGGEFDDVQVCDAPGRLWQVEYGRPGTDDDTIYFLVERKDRWTFVLKDIGGGKRDGCKSVEGNPREPFPTMFAKPLEW